MAYGLFDGQNYSGNKDIFLVKYQETIPTYSVSRIAHRLTREPVQLSS